MFSKKTKEKKKKLICPDKIKEKKSQHISRERKDLTKKKKKKEKR